MVQEFTRQSDLAFANLECVLSNKGLNRYSISSVELRGDPASARLLHDANIHLINIANNHIFQHGRGAYLDTISNLERFGLKVVGTDSPSGSKLTVIRMKGICLGVIGYSLHYEQYRPYEKVPYALRTSYAQILSEIEVLCRGFAGLVVCSLHWGHEYVGQPSKSQQGFARQLIDNGVSLVLGHHAHVLQGFESYRDGLIAYGLGNFLFDSQEPEGVESVALKVDFNKHAIQDYTTIPAVIGADFGPRIAVGRDKQRIEQRLARLDTLLEEGDVEDDMVLKSFATQHYRRMRLASYRYFLRNWYRYNPLYFVQSIIRALLRRMKLVQNP
jgi:poly-gamma-glutamate synthesis protein (capsule biosynthesis protein)